LCQVYLYLINSLLSSTTLYYHLTTTGLLQEHVDELLGEDQLGALALVVALALMIFAMVDLVHVAEAGELGSMPNSVSMEL
jgi:hypothetical protein